MLVVDSRRPVNGGRKSTLSAAYRGQCTALHDLGQPPSDPGPLGPSASRLPSRCDPPTHSHPVR